MRDYGLPIDAEALEKQLHGGGSGTAMLDWPGSDAADEVHWIGYGREGKAIQFIKWLHDDHVEDSAGAVLTPFHDEAPLAPPQEYSIRRLLPGEAMQVSQLMYRAYGNTYLYEDVYYPERVAALNANNKVLSFVAVGADGQIAGHYALELNQEGPVGEGGQAVVDPAHRGRGLLDRMKDAGARRSQAAESRRLVRRCRLRPHDDAAIECETWRTPNVTNLAVAPASQSFHKISEKQTQRISCMLFFHWLQPPTLRTIYVPPRHRDIVAAIYANLECPIEFGESAQSDGLSKLRISVDTNGGKANIRAEQLHTIRPTSSATRSEKSSNANMPKWCSRNFH